MFLSGHLSITSIPEHRPLPVSVPVVLRHNSIPTPTLIPLGHRRVAASACFQVERRPETPRPRVCGGLVKTPRLQP